MSRSPLGGALLAGYRVTTRALGPLVRRHLVSRAARGREDAARLEERFGVASRARPEGPLVWLHAASIGESLSALPLIDRLRQGWPALPLLLTTGTTTSARLMLERLPEGVIHQYAPVDLEPAVRRFVGHWRPSAGLLLESEFWPTLLHHAEAAGCALAVVNGRVSAGSYRSWRRVLPVIRSLLDPFELILAQSPEDRAHFEALGARRVDCLGNLKFAGPPLAADERALSSLRAAVGARPLWLAASTHPGEEAIAAEVHAALAQDRPDLLTLIAPRHPERGAEIAALLAERGLSVRRRSLGEAPGPETAVYLADTIGEMGLWYRLAEAVFVGGSLVPHGGQNPLEPAKLGCAILSGPHTGNFRQVTREMLTAGAQRELADAAALAEALAALLDDPAARAAMAAAARRYADTQAGVLDAVVQALSPMLDRIAGSAPRPCQPETRLKAL